MNEYIWLNTFKHIVSQLDTEEGRLALSSITRGIEREALRVDKQGKLAQNPHPKQLGSALTHPWITTDYSESLLEFITPAHQDIKQLISQLTDIQRFTLQNIQEQSLWPTSMPCFVEKGGHIPIAQYGSSLSGKMKTLYREGLTHRYGAFMQIISGVHFNFSVSKDLWAKLHNIEKSDLLLKDYQSEGYFRLIRNFQRTGWIVPYLFGASPALCSTFLEKEQDEHKFESLGRGTLYLPYATSLRMSDLGYTSTEQKKINVSYNSLPDYLETLNYASQQRSETFRALGLFDGEQRKQLNDRVLQIENEFYSIIRPKRVAQAHEKPSQALSRAGVEYIEIRALDVNPFSAVGIDEDQIRIMDLILLVCLLTESEPIFEADKDENEFNFQAVVLQGRDPDLCLLRRGERVSIKSWLSELFEKYNALAVLLDHDSGNTYYQDSLKRYQRCIDTPEQTLSGQMMTDLLEKNTDFVTWSMRLASKYRHSFEAGSYLCWSEQEFIEQARKSWQEQQDKERKEQGDFEEFLQAYFSK